jgi:hypothetical protein
MRGYRAGMAIAGSLLAAGCAGNGSGLDANGRPIGAAGSGAGPLAATYESIQDNVFTPICTVCHAGGGAPQGLRLDASNAYTLLVGIPSTEEPSILRVKPGDPGNSYLVQKLEGHAAVGAQMPFGEPPLPAETIAAIRQWITDGATRAVATAGTPLQISAVVPANGEMLAAPREIAIGFTRELDASRVDAGTARLERVGDTLNPMVDVIAGRLMIPSANARALILVPSTRLTPGRYRVVLRGDPSLSPADLEGHPLQGGVRTETGDWLVTTFAVGAAP